MNTSRTGFPTGPGGFPGAADGFQPPFRGTVRSSSSSSSSSSSRPRPRGGVVTNYFGASIRRDPPSTTTRTVYRNDDDEFVEMVDEEEFRASFHSWRTNKFYYVEPEPDELTPVQRAWLQGYINRLEAALYGREFKDPIKGYAAYLDVDSFIDYHLLVEATKNVDGFRFSTFFHKDRGGKVKMGPLWDWNLSFGNCNGKQGYMPEWWLWPQLDDREYCWFRRLFEDPDFGQKYVDRWSQLRASALATSNVLARVDTLVGSLQEAQARNFQRWPILGLAVSPNWYVGDTYEEEIKWMKEWIVSRLAWIDKQFVPAPALVSAPGAPCALEAAQGTIYYTTDGSDPRASGGTMGPQAKRYEQPVQVGPARLIARAQDGKRWSAPLVLGRR